jgi:hypothetical protein
LERLAVVHGVRDRSVVAHILTQKVEAPIILINFGERWRGYLSINTGRQPSGESFHLRANAVDGHSGLRRSTCCVQIKSDP